MPDYQRLRAFAKTDTQRQTLDALIEHGSYRAAARALNKGHSALVANVQRVETYVQQVEAQAARRGYAPDQDLRRPAAVGFQLAGYTIGDHPGQDEPTIWHKFTADKDQQFAAIEAAARAMAEDIKPVPAVPRPKATKSQLCNLYTLSDAHVGSLADNAETQTGDWDISKAEQVLVGCFEEMINSAPKAESCIINDLGDSTHYESITATETPMNRNVLDSDTRYGRLVEAHIRIMRRIVDLALRKHKHVTLLICEGNHNSSSSLVFRKMYSALYENEKRLTVHDFDLPFYALKFGSVLIGSHHGHLKKKENLPLLFAAQFPEFWGETKKRYIHTGHLHHHAVQEHSGVTVTQHPTLAARDAHAARHGYMSNREAICVTYHKDNGQVATTHVTPEMLETA